MMVGYAHVQVGAAVMLTWGLSMTTLTLRLLKVAEREQLVAGAFLSIAYGLLATPLVRWLAR